MFKFSILLCDKKTVFKFGNVLSKILFAKSVNVFLGNIGIGKTSLTKGIIENLLNYNLNIKSPTYTIVETYYLFNKIIHHFDFYRLNNSHDLFDLDFKNYIIEDSILIIEWGNILYKTVLPHIFVYFFYYAKYKRILILKSNFLDFNKLFG